MKKIVLTLLTITTIASQACESINVNTLSGSLDKQREILSDAQFDCPSLDVSLKLAQVFADLGETRNSYDTMQEARNDQVKNDSDRLKWLITNTELAISKQETCAANKSLNELALFKNFQNGKLHYQRLRATLYQTTQNKTLDSQSIGCALTASRSITVQSPATRGLRIIPKLDIAIHFATDKAVLSAQGRTQAQKLAQALNTGNLENKNITLIGHTDIIGADTYNQGLSERRAQAVKAYLTQLDASLSYRIKTQGKGEYDLLTTGTSRQDHQLNRRVEIQVNQKP